MADRCLRSLVGHTESINTVKFTHDGQYCMTVSNDRTAKLWNPHSNDPRLNINQSTSNNNDLSQALLIQTYAGTHGYKILDIAITQDKSRFVTAGGDK